MEELSRHFKILLVEDNPMDIQFIEQALIDKDRPLFDLECVNRLQSALECLEKEKIDEVILDLSLPDSQGFETLRKIHSKAPNIPIIVLTVFKDETFAVNMIKEGAQDYLIKGHIDTESLSRILRYAIERKQIEEELKNYRLHLEELVEERTAKLEQEVAERQRIEDALKESEEKFKSVVENIGIGVSLISPQMEILSLNKIMRKWFPDIDVSKKPLCYRSFNKPPRETVCFYCPTYKTLQDGQVHESITQTPAGDKILNYRIISSPIKDKEGEIIAAIEMVEDITEHRKMEAELKKHYGCLGDLVKERTTKLEQEISERKKIEQALRESQNRYIALLASIPQKIFYKDLNSVYVLCNDSYAKDLNLEPSQIKGKTDYDFYPKKLAEKYRADDNRIMQSGIPEELEERYIQHGQEFIVQTYKVPVKDGNGKTIGIFGVFWDITERRLAEEEIEKFKTIAEDANYGIAIADIEGKLEYINEYFAAIHGYKPEELRGKNLIIFHTAEQLEEVRQALKELKETGSFSAREIWHKHKNGSVFPMLMNGIAIRDEKDKSLFMAATAIDISEYKKAQLERENLTKELIESNKKFKKLSLIDPQTGLYNHRYLEEIIEREFQHSRRYYSPLSVILLDIDYFKSINDVYGHKFGDLVLKQLAGQLKRMVRRYDIVIRSGGEEFTIVSPRIDRSSTLILGQRLLDAISLCDFGDRKHRVKLKLSVAVASYPEDKIFRDADLVNLADQIIAKVKEFGGNRVGSSLDIQKEKDVAIDKIKQTPEIKLLRSKIDKLNRRSNQSLVEAIFAFAKTIEVKDRYTGEHVEKTVYYATEIACELKLSKEEIGLIRQAAMLHDLGKIGISEKILLKKSKLTETEFTEVKKHPQVGADILRPIQLFHGIIPLIYYHHERWDGKGYLMGLKGEEIPIGARIIALADVYQALISDRPYRKAYPKEKAITIIKKGSGTQFDPHIVDVFLRVIQKEK